MATFADQYTLSQDAAFKNKVQIAMLVAASAVLAQTTPKSGELAAAQRIVDNPASYVADVANLAVLNVTIAGTAPSGTTATDAQIQTAVNAALLQLVR